MSILKRTTFDAKETRQQIFDETSPHFKPRINKEETLRIREGCEKKTGKNVVFCQTGGGGVVSDGSKMPNFYFGKVFFQLACRIILGPPKHVLHLV